MIRTMLPIISVLIVLGNIQIGVLGDTFNFRECYSEKMEDRMPLSMDNLISLIEKYEKDHSTAASDMAEALLNRYRKNGVIYCPSTGYADWGIHQTIEADKQELDDDLLKLRLELPEDLYTFREECALHMMLSHSTDTYPHSGVDVMWENSNYYSASTTNTRSKRSVSGNCLGDNDPAEHPIEMGVVQTNAGPVAAGILLSGISSMMSSSSYTIESLLGSSTTSYMPKEMRSKKISVFYGSTISGELGQAGVLNGKIMSSNDFEVGPSGRFGNKTCCPRLFSLQNNDLNYYSLSRAELFAGLDALLISEGISNYGSSSSNVKLSHILRMYYGDHGLFWGDIKSCNRLKLSNILGKEEILENALNYMYAYQDNFPDMKAFVKQNSDNFDDIERLFTETRDYIYEEVRSFLQSYKKDDQGYYDCIEHEDILPETTSNVIVIYSPTGSETENEMQSEYITHIARNIGVGHLRSNLALLDPGYGGWQSPTVLSSGTFSKLLSKAPSSRTSSYRTSSSRYSSRYSDDPEDEESTEDGESSISLNSVDTWFMDETLYSNVADWSCNFTDTLRSGGSSQQDFEEVLDSLEKVYSKYYRIVRASEDFVATKSHVVIWNLPGSFTNDEETMRERWNNFNMTYPDVSFIFLGETSNILDTFLDYENTDLDYDEFFVSTSGKTAEKVALDVVPMVLSAPRMFVYPNCDTTEKDEDEISSLESSHNYKLYISPNRTTLMRIPPQNFHFSETLTLWFSGKDVSVCISRVNKLPTLSDKPEETYCGENTFDVTENELCGRYVNQCSPIYISVTGQQISTSSCSGDDCLFPNQVELEMTHGDMTCGSYGLTPMFLTLILSIVICIVKL